MVSAAQLEMFQHGLATVVVEGHETGSRMSNRDLQPLNGRPVLFSEEGAAQA